MRKALSLKSENVILTSHNDSQESQEYLKPAPKDPPASDDKKNDRKDEKNNNMIHLLEKKMEEKLQKKKTVKENEGGGKKQKDMDIRAWVQKNWKPTTSSFDVRIPIEKDAMTVASKDYLPDILQYMKNREMKYRASHNYMQKRKFVDEGNRATLINWLHDVVRCYRKQTESLHLAVSIVDRFVSIHEILKKNLQLVGTAAMLIAIKYEENKPPKMGEFEDITGNTYSAEEILKMEQCILMSLDFTIGPPTSSWFGNCFANRLHFSRKMKRTVQYLLNLSLLEVDFLRYRPSIIAAAAVCSVNIFSDMTEWPDDIQEDTKIRKSDIVECVKDLIDLFKHATELHPNMYRKYSGKEQEEVALMQVPTKKIYEFLMSDVEGNKAK